MSNKGEVKSVLTIVIIVAIVIFGIFYFSVINKKQPIEYYKLQAQKKSENVLIKDYDSFKKLIKTSGADEEMVNSSSYEKENVLEFFNNEFFSKNNLALVCTYEDTSKEYIYSVDDVIYDKDKKSATIVYTNKTGGYSGLLKNSWFNYMLVKLDKSVESVVFEKNNTTEEN